MNALLIIQLLFVSLIPHPLWGVSDYYVRPTQPANSSCPGQPCLTLSQYINNTDLYFKSNNNSVFWLLSGTHHISSPVVITDAHNITLQKYEGRDDPLVTFNSTNYCVCPQSLGVCQECSAFQFYNTSGSTVKDIELLATKFNATSSINGLSFISSDTITVQSVSVTVIVAGAESSDCIVMDGFKFLYSLCGGTLLEETTETYLLNMTLHYSGIEAYSSNRTVVRNLTVTSPPRHGITVHDSSGMAIKQVHISQAKSHCIRLENTTEVSVSDGRLLSCGDNGIEVIRGFNTVLDSIHFRDMVSKALQLSKSTNTNLTNWKIHFCPLFCVNIEFVSNTLFENVTVTECGVLGDNIMQTVFVNLNMTNSDLGMTLVNAKQTQIRNSYLIITRSTINALFVTDSSDTEIEHVTTNSSVSIENCSITVFDGIRIRNVSNRPALLVYKSKNATVRNSNFNNYVSFVTDITDHPAAVVLYQSRDIHFHHCTFTQNTISALKAVGSNLTLSGSVKFTNNTAPLGAAVVLQQKSVVTLAHNSSLLFVGNHATSVGGAIYVDTNTFYSIDSENIILHSECIFYFKGKDIEFHNNSAGSGGDVVYGGHMELATTADGSNCLQQFKTVSVMNQTSSMSVISSQPSRVCVCDSSGLPDCLAIFHSNTVFPGETFSLAAVVVGQDFGTGTGSVYSQFLSSDEGKKVGLKQWQYSQGVSQTHCNQLSYSILAAPTDSSVLVLTAVEVTAVQVISNTTVQTAVEKYRIFQNGTGPFPQELLDFPVYINISVQPCPVGFSLSEPPYRCVCGPQLRQLPGVKCHLESQTIERSGTVWVGVKGDKEMVVSQYCLFFLCKENAVNVTVNNLDLQCNYNHSGVLCGRCQKGLSLALGTHRCLRCSNKYLSLLVPIALAGVILVVGIKILDITVSSGYVNGLVLYFNTIHPIWTVIDPQNGNNVLAVFVYWMNLNFGIETCFFDGLTAYWRAWLQFLFPLYLWTISGALILLARHSSRLAAMMGSNPVSVFATLFLLSYTKLLRTCITIISYSLVVYPQSTKTVWSFDGSMEYLGAEHLPLFAVAVAVLVFLCAPYTLILLLGQWLNKCDNRLISRAMFRIKPIMDAYYGPLKDKHRYWVGMLLLSRAIPHVVLALAPTAGNKGLLLALSLLALCLLQMNGYVMGFYRSWYVSVFEITIIWNLALYSLTKLYTEQTESGAKFTIDNLFTAAGIAQLCLLILYRLFCLARHLVPGRLKSSLTESVRGGSEREEDWEAYEEASLLRHNHEALNEKTPISINSLPTYGT